MMNTEPRYKSYGCYDVHTGELVAKFPKRSQAKAHKGLNHNLRVRGIEPKR